MQINVLHLDDSLSERLLVQKELKTSGQCSFKVESFGTSKEFLIRLRQGPPPEVVILDIHLEGENVDGIVIARECRKHSNDLIIVMRSSLTGLSIRESASRNGADAFVGKDKSIAHLAKEISLLVQALSDT